MNYRVAQWVRGALRTLDVSPLTACVAHALAGYTDRNGACWPGLPELCEITKLSRSSVIRHIQVLEDVGILSVTRATGRVNRYRFPFASPLEVVPNPSTTSVTGDTGSNPLPVSESAPTSVTAVALGGVTAVTPEHEKNVQKEHGPIPDEFFAARQALRRRWRAG